VVIDPAIHPRRESRFAKQMDARVEPAHDEMCRAGLATPETKWPIGHPIS
jgi:hypothetical protein